MANGDVLEERKLRVFWFFRCAFNEVFKAGRSVER